MQESLCLCVPGVEPAEQAGDRVCVSVDVWEPSPRCRLALTLRFGVCICENGETGQMGERQQMEGAVVASCAGMIQPAGQVTVRLCVCMCGEQSDPQGR